MVSIEEDIDVDAIVDEASGGGSNVDIGGGPDPGDVRVDIGGGGDDDDDDGSTGPGAGGTGIPGAPSDEQPDTSGDDGGGGVDVGPGGDVSTIDEGGPSGGGTGGGTQPPTAQDPGDVQTQPIIDDAREDLADRVRDAPGGGGRAGDLTSADIEQFERDILAGRVRDATPGPGEDPTGVDVMQIGGGPRPGDVRVEDGVFARPKPPTGPRPVEGQGIETETAGEGAPEFTIDDPRPNRDTFTGTRPEIARLIESLAVDSPGQTLGPEDVAVIETDEGLGVRITTGGLRSRWLSGQLARDVGRSFQSDAATAAAIGNLGAIRTAVEQEAESQRNLGRVDVSGGEAAGDVRVDITGEPADLDLSMRPWGATGPLQVTGGPGAGDVRVGFGAPEGDFTVSPVAGEPGRFDIGLTESRTRKEAAFGFEQEFGVQFDPQEDIKLTDDGAQLTRSGEIALANAPEEFGDRQIRDAGDLPIVGSGVEWWSGVVGREPFGVSDLPSNVGLETELAATRQTGPGPRRTVLEQRATGVDVDTFGQGTTLEEALTAASLSYSEFVGDVAEANVEYNPFARATVAGAERFGRGEEAETAIEAAVVGAGELVNVPALGLTVKEAGEFVPYAARETGAGRGGVSFDPIQTEPQAGQVVGGAGPLGVPSTQRTSVIDIEDEGLAPEVAESAEASIREFETYARENPVEFGGAAVGSLAASAVLMGGAARISPRLGLATRGIIQPGEELFGRGGFALTRRFASPRTARRFFPNKEPLIFSEEAAIRGAQRFIGGARRGSQRVRARGTDIVLGEAETVTETSPSSFEGFWNIETRQERPGVRTRLEDVFGGTDRGQLGPAKGFVRGETERAEEATEVITAEDIARPRLDPDQGPFWDPTTRDLEREGEAPINPAREVSRPLIETEVERAARRRYETAIAPFTQPAAAVEVGSQAMQQFSVDQEQRTRVGSRAETAVDVEQLLGLETELAEETRVDTELDVRTEMELLRELEAEGETEFEFEFEIETPSGGEADGDATATDQAGGEAESSVIGRAFGPAWLNQWAVALAGGGLAARQAPENIEQIARERGTFLGLPTAGQVDPDEELRAGLEAVDEFFFRGGGNTEDATETANDVGRSDDELLAFLDFGDGEADSGTADEDPWGLL